VEYGVVLMVMVFWWR